MHLDAEAAPPAPPSPFRSTLKKRSRRRSKRAPLPTSVGSVQSSD